MNTKELILSIDCYTLESCAALQAAKLSESLLTWTRVSTRGSHTPCQYVHQSAYHMGAMCVFDDLQEVLSDYITQG